MITFGTGPNGGDTSMQDFERMVKTQIGEEPPLSFTQLVKAVEQNQSAVDLQAYLMTTGMDAVRGAVKDGAATIDALTHGRPVNVKTHEELKKSAGG